MSYFPSKKKLDIANISQVKSSVARGIRCECTLAVRSWLQDRMSQTPALSHLPAASICEEYPYLEETGVIELLIPKKESVFVGKWCVPFMSHTAPDNSLSGFTTPYYQPTTPPAETAVRDMCRW